MILQELIKLSEARDAADKEHDKLLAMGWVKSSENENQIEYTHKDASTKIVYNKKAIGNSPYLVKSKKSDRALSYTTPKKAHEAALKSRDDY